MLRRSLVRSILALASLVPLTTTAGAQPRYERRELSIPVRDGTTLFAVALIPREPRAPLPILLTRTPFGAEYAIRDTTIPGSYRELMQDGYILVAQDIRGRARSGGRFETQRPLRDPRDPRDAKGTDESTDAYDTIDWLVKNLPNTTGKVGVLGMSYGGWLAGMAAIDPHSALAAIAPQGPMVDTWLGDDFFHQGAFRQNQAVPYAAFIEGDGNLTIKDYDQYSFYLRQSTLSALGRTTGVDTLPIWKGARAHPARDDFWRRRALQEALTTPKVPTLSVGGLWDEEDRIGAELLYRTLERRDTKGINHVVLGPWYHTQWNRPGGDSLGPIALGSRTADHFRDAILRPWFAHWLHGAGDGRFPEATVFESGANEWRTFSAWPPAEAKATTLYLREGGRLSFDAPTATADAFDAFTADPARPVPYMPRPDNGEEWHTWMQQDQRFVDGRPDVLTWSTGPLDADLTIAGDVAAHLFASTTGSDADWVVKLIDVYPDSVAGTPTMGGYELIVTADIMRGRYWRGFDRATPIVPRQVTPFTVALHDQLYRFRKGHSVMVQVQSSWFPLYDRNPQRFVANIFEAKPADFRAQEHRVWHTPRYPSSVEVRVLR